MEDPCFITSPIKVLYVEDSSADVNLVEQSLKDGGLACDIHRVETCTGLIEKLEHSEYDLVLSDSSLPAFSGNSALQIVRYMKPEIPFIFVSGTMGEESAIESLRHGATDYVLKHRLSRLVPAVNRALLEAREKSLRQTIQKRLQQSRRMDAIGTLASGLAHDFNNVLTVIKAHVDLLAPGNLPPDEMANITERLRKAVDQGSYLTKELLIFGRKTETKPTFLNVTERIRETSSILTEALPKNVTLVLRLQESMPPIFMDAGHLDRILTNLVMNARDAMPEGGTITIEAGEAESAPAAFHFKEEEKAGRLCLTVSDTGQGMDEMTRQRAFEPFYTTKIPGKGTGLGLSVVFGLMQIHDGTIDLQSEVHKGTTVALYFPLHHDSHFTSESLREADVSSFTNGC